MATATKKPALLQLGVVVPVLRDVLEGAYDIYPLDDQEDEVTFLAKKGDLIHGVVTCEDPHCEQIIVAMELLSKLPNLEIVSSFDQRDLNKAMDLRPCKRLGVHVTDIRDAVMHLCAPAVDGGCARSLLHGTVCSCA
ncbi:unnamed protein product [Calypogeia fissa]